MNEGFEIPIGGDLGPLAEAFDSIIASIDKLGDRIVAALEKSNTAVAGTVSQLGNVTTASGAASAAQNQLAAATGASAAKLQQSAANAANVGTALTGLQSGLTISSKAAKTLTGVNLATALSGWIAKAGGIRGAFAKIPAILSAVAKNPVFRKIAIGAGVAIAGILAIRTAWRTAAAGARLLRSTAAAVFRSIRSLARGAASAIKGTFSKIFSLPGKLLSAGPLAGILGAAGAAALLVGQLKSASASASTFEDLTISVEQFIGSTEAAKALLSDLQQFSIKTNFETIDVQQTAAGLLGAGVRGDVAGITKDLAAMAKDGESLKELGDALGKGFSKGKFQTEEINKFLERGINLNPALQAQIGLTGEAFQKAVEAGLGFEDVTAAIASMSAAGGPLFGLLERRAGSFKGLLSTLAGAWNDIRQAFGQPINDALKPILQAGIDKLTSLLEKARELGAKVGRAITIAFVAFKEGRAGELFSAGLNLAVAVAVDTLMRGLRGAAAFLAASLPPIFAALGAKFSDPAFWAGLAMIFKGLGNTLGAAIRRSLPNAVLNAKEIVEQNRIGEEQQKKGMLGINQAGNVDVGKAIKKAFGDGGQAAKDAASGPLGNGVTTARASLQAVTDSLGAAADKIQEATAASTALNPQEPSEPLATSIEDSVTKAVQAKTSTLTTSRGRVGGGGFGISFGSSLIAVANKGNAIAAKIERNTRGLTSGKTIPVLA